MLEADCNKLSCLSFFNIMFNKLFLEYTHRLRVFPLLMSMHAWMCFGFFWNPWFRPEFSWECNSHHKILRHLKSVGGAGREGEKRKRERLNWRLKENNISANASIASSFFAEGSSSHSLTTVIMMYTRTMGKQKKIS